MTTRTLKQKLGSKMLLLALPFLALMAFAAPAAHADDHHRGRRDREVRREGRHFDRGGGRHFDRGGGRYYGRGDDHRRYRRYFRRGGRRYYYYTEDRYYYGPPPSGVSFHIVL